MEEMTDRPEEHTGTPQAAAAESAGDPAIDRRAQEIAPARIDLVKIGERHRTAGLLHPMPDDVGGGFMRIRPASVTSVSSARDDHERKIRKVPKVKRHYKQSDDLGGKPGTELNRFTVVMACVQWISDRPLQVSAESEPVWPQEMSEVELRKFISEHFLPELDLYSDVPPEMELNMSFLLALLDGLGEVSKAPAQEIAKLGKDYKTGLSESADYSG